jgi:hypothetical protein
MLRQHQGNSNFWKALHSRERKTEGAAQQVSTCIRVKHYADCEEGLGMEPTIQLNSLPKDRNP